MATITENHVEEATLAWLSNLGFAVANGPDLAPEGRAPERTSYGEVILTGRLKAALRRLNPTLDDEVLDSVARKISWFKGAVRLLSSRLT